jgi:hypothetical protein
VSAVSWVAEQVARAPKPSPERAARLARLLDLEPKSRADRGAARKRLQASA